ncbi:DUF262 domain-containing protein [Micromonospora schwarzwaldensis]|uniref:DUF262 domain-containing protein n=1 Tax=Micromonospora sp. DSM 45708 TaxID=3111767 RepID=UPI0031CFB882
MWHGDAVDRFFQAQERLVTQTSDFSMMTIASMVEEGYIDPLVETRRRRRWDQARQSALIESFLLNIPVPPLYFAQTEDFRYSIIDGSQRIYAIHSFMRGELVLKSLQAFPELNGSKIYDLPDAIVKSLHMRPHIRAVTLLNQSDPTLKYEVFVRLNKGGQALNNQEVRNIAFEGPLNDLLIRLSSAPFLRAQFKITDDSDRYRRMQDVEYVLRFIAFAADGIPRQLPVSDFLDHFMMRHANDKEDTLERYAADFRRALHGCQKIWGERAFQAKIGFARTVSGSVQLYDAQMLAVAASAEIDVEKAASRRNEIIEATDEITAHDPQFGLNQATSPKRLTYRVERIAQLIQG